MTDMGRVPGAAHLALVATGASAALAVLAWLASRRGEAALEVRTRERLSSSARGRSAPPSAADIKVG